MKLSRKLTAGELKEFIKTSKDVFVSGSNMILQPRTGVVTFDFSAIDGVHCIFRFIRKSGNGLILLTSGRVQKQYQIASMRGQDIGINIEGGRVTVSRTQRGMGDLAIVEVSIYKNLPNWDVELKRAKGHSCIRKVGDDLHASEGGSIQGDVLLIETSPDNAYVREGDIVKFVKSCEILKLSVCGQPPPPFIKSNTILNNQPKQQLFVDSINCVIKDDFRHYSILKKDEYVVNNKIIKNGILELNCFESKLWYNRVNSCFSNIGYCSKNHICYHNEKPEKQEANIQLTSINYLHKHNRIFLQPFYDRYFLTEKNINILKQAKEIITPSLVDMLKIRDKLPDSNINICYLPLPILDIEKYTTKDYYIYIEQDSDLTEKLISVWDHTKGNLYIIGSNLTVPSWCKKISYLCSYTDFFKYIVESKGIIDISKNKHYISNIIELAKSYNINILTNNHNYINDHMVVDIDNIKTALYDFYNINTNCVFNNIYLNDIDKNINIILGIQS